MEGMDSIQEVFSEDKERKDVSKFPNEEFENQKIALNKEDVKDSVEEIENIDFVSKIKITEENVNKAKLFKDQAEEESRNILAELICSEMSSDVEINSQEFTRLLDEEENLPNVLDPSDKLGQNESVQTNDKKGEKKEEKKEKGAKVKFIKKNIQLAKCGRGTLSLTEEEKLRIENLLVDSEDSEAKSVEELKKKEDLNPISENEKKFYAMDEETKIILNQIDQQLEMFKKEKRKPEEKESKISLLDKTESEEKHFDENEKENPMKGKLKKKESSRLKEINNLLHSMNSVSNEEINPLTVEEIKSLVRQSEQSLSLLQPPFVTEDKKWPSSRVSEEVIAELVSNAKLLMPKFKYRFDES